MRIPFDQRTVPGLSCTRMPGSATVVLSPVGCRRLNAGLAMAAALTFVVWAFPITGMAPVQKHEAHHEIEQLEDEWRNALLTSNARELDSLLAEDYMAITPSGTLQTKEEALDNLRSGRVHFSVLDVTDRKVRFYGTTAIVTSLANVQATTPDGTVNGNYRYTRVYARDPQGRWRIVSFEASRVREPGPHKRNELH
jgi:ketosteroid isomerase-like protein